MALRFFENSLNLGVNTSPNEMYREQQQAYITEQWDNTSAKFHIQEQQGIGSSEYQEIEVWVDMAVADTTTGMKYSEDFLKLTFHDIDHRVVKGLMYQMDDNYWIIHNYNYYNGLAQDCGIRRCNNALKIVDPLNGTIRSFPCIVDYDMGASSNQVSRYVITPNNHAVVMVQGNDDTNRLLKTNTRYMLAGRPFKLYGYQNTIFNNETVSQSTLLYLDLYLDELRDGDDIVTGVADNGTYDYAISINSDNLQLAQGSTGTLSAVVTLNGEEVDSTVVWSTVDPGIIKIDENGVYEVVGEVGQSTLINANLSGNSNVNDYITITIGEVGDDIKIITNPAFNKIRQYQSIDFNVETYYNGVLVDGATVEVSVPSGYVTLTSQENEYILACNKIASTPQPMIIKVQCADPVIDETVTLDIATVSMMG